MVAVGELDAAVVDLIALGDELVVFVGGAGEGRFMGREVGEDGELVLAEVGLDVVGEEVVGAGGWVPGRGSELVEGGERGVVDAEIGGEGVAVAEVADGEGAEEEEEVFTGLLDHLSERDVRAVPLEHGELGVVQRADFPFAIDVAEEVAVADALREEAF